MTLDPVVRHTAFPCTQCDRVLKSARGRTYHLRVTHGIEAECGTPEMYRIGCRCERCKAAEQRNRPEYRRRYGDTRPIDDSPETLKACLLAFGVEPEKLDEALTTRTIETAHWSAWRASGDLRKHCRCALPWEIAAEMRRAS